MTSNEESVTVLVADLRALLDAADPYYLSTTSLTDLGERIERLQAAAWPEDDENPGGCETSVI